MVRAITRYVTQQSRQEKTVISMGSEQKLYNDSVVGRIVRKMELGVVRKLLSKNESQENWNTMAYTENNRIGS